MKYDEDLYQWTIEQGRALRDRATNAPDYDNVAEEIESLGRSDKREIEVWLENLLVHLVKQRCQPEQRSPSWEASIDEARRRIARIIRDSHRCARMPRKS
jgi:ribosomal protein L29